MSAKDSRNDLRAQAEQDSADRKQMVKLSLEGKHGRFAHRSERLLAAAADRQNGDTGKPGFGIAGTAHLPDGKPYQHSAALETRGGRARKSKPNAFVASRNYAFVVPENLQHGSFLVDPFKVQSQYLAILTCAQKWVDGESVVRAAMDAASLIGDLRELAEYFAASTDDSDRGRVSICNAVIQSIRSVQRGQKPSRTRTRADDIVALKVNADGTVTQV